MNAPDQDVIRKVRDWVSYADDVKQIVRLALLDNSIAITE